MPRAFEVALVFRDDRGQMWVSLGLTEIEAALRRAGVSDGAAREAVQSVLESLDRKARASVPPAFDEKKGG